MNFRKQEKALWRQHDVMMTSSMAMSSRLSSAGFQSADLGVAGMRAMGGIGAARRGGPSGGGAAQNRPPELGRRRAIAVAGAGAHRGDATEGERDGREHRRVEELTAELWSSSAKAEESCSAGIGPVAGGRTRRRRARRGRFGAPRVDSFDGEGRGSEAEPKAASTEFGDGRSSGNRRRPELLQAARFSSSRGERVRGESGVR
jgi:hypothetical protein